MSELRAVAPAKLNLYLHVTGRRPDGYHLLDSLVAFAAVHDSLSVRPAARLSLSLGGPFAAALGAPGRNLVMRAARELARAAGVEAGAALRLVKRLPVAAGMGGGSADAAAALGLLTRLWRAEIAPAVARRLELRLGADVPVCRVGRAAFVGGIGEAVEPIPLLPAASLVLVNPRLPLATRAVFEARAGAYGAPARFAMPADAHGLAAALKARRNELTPAAIGLRPEIRHVLEVVAATAGCLLARMSGSGPTCFGLYGKAAAAAAAADAIARDHPGWWVVDTPLVGAPLSLPAAKG